MRWFDGHCDVLWKMWKDPHVHSFYDEGSKLDVTYNRLQEANVQLQIFAIFVPAEVSHSQRLEVALMQIDHFYERVIQDGRKIRAVLHSDHLAQISSSKLGALLSLEGADSLQGELSHLRTFYRLGVRQMGLTWNHANEVADGIEEDRGGGLTHFGQKVVTEMKKLGMILDVSHLSVRGFWEVMEHWGPPIVASHSNCRAICPHIRNLDDGQIQALIQNQGLIGMTFVPSFVYQPPLEASIEQLLRHIEHICILGGENNLCFGSDFDGIQNKIPQLENFSYYNHLKEALLKRYPENLVRKWAWENAYQFYYKYLSKR